MPFTEGPSSPFTLQWEVQITFRGEGEEEEAKSYASGLQSPRSAPPEVPPPRPFANACWHSVRAIRRACPPMPVLVTERLEG